PDIEDTGICNIIIIVCDEVGACDTQEFTIVVLPETSIVADTIWFYQETECNNENLVVICYNYHIPDDDSVFTELDIYDGSEHVTASTIYDTLSSYPLPNIGWVHNGEHCFVWDMGADYPGFEGCDFDIQISIHNETTELLTVTDSFPLTDAEGIAYDGEYLWVSSIASAFSDTVVIYRIDPITHEILDSCTFYNLMVNMHADLEWHNDTLYMMQGPGSKMFVIDPATCTIVDSSNAMWDTEYWGQGIAWNNGYLWLTNTYGHIYRVDPYPPYNDTLWMSIEDTFLTYYGDSLFAAPVTADAIVFALGYMWLLRNPSGSTTHILFQIDSTGMVIDSFALPAAGTFGPEGLTFDGSYFWYTNCVNDMVYRVDLMDLKIMNIGCLDSKSPNVDISCPTIISAGEEYTFEWSVDDLFFNDDPCSLYLFGCGIDERYETISTFFNWIPPYGCESCTLVVAARDSFCNWGYDTCFLSIHENHPPEIISEPPESTVYVDSTWEYHVIATDPDGDSLTYGVFSDCTADISVDDAGYVWWIPDEEDTGICNITIIVCDEVGACDTQEFTIEVLPNPNIPLEFVNCPEESIIVFAEGDTIITINALDEDSNIASCSLSTYPASVSFWEDSIVCESGSFEGFLHLHPSESDTGIYEFAFEVCDDDTCVYCEFVIIVLDTINHPPEIVSDPPETIVYVDSTWDYIVIVDDEDDDSLTFDIESDCDTTISIIVVDDTTGYISWIPDIEDTGICNIIIIVCDEIGACDTQEFTIEVLPNDVPPEPPMDFLAEACGPEIYLSWTPPGDADIEGYVIYRGFDEIVLEIIDTIAGDLTFSIDMPYLLDTTYYYAVSAFDSAGYSSPLSEIDSAYPFPYHLNGLEYELAGDNQIELSWSPTTIDSMYLIFYAEGDTLPNFTDTSAIVYAPDSTWTSPILTIGVTYTFAIQVLATCGYLDASGDIYIIITIPDSEWECKHVHIVIPKPGKGLCGNSALVKAKSDCPGAWWHDISTILFQKRFLPDGEWTDITNLHPDIHPNPDSTHPYQIHWRVELEEEGDYLIRAIAYDTDSIPDPYPDAIPIHIGPPCGYSDYAPDSSKGVPYGYKFEYWERAYPHAGAKIDIGDFDDTEDWIYLPIGFIAEPDILTFRMTNRDENTEPYYSIGEFMDLELRSGAEVTASGDSIAWCLQYPDFDNDGFVDGTSTPENSLLFFQYNGVSWGDSIACLLDTETNIITASTNNFGRFAILSTESRIKEIKHPDRISMALFPMPSNAAVAIVYHLPSTSEASLNIYDVMGHQVATLVDELKTAGTHTTTWSPQDDIPSGIYFVCLKAGEQTITKRAILIR
ncbi:hypothetical protein DRQ33_03425, partial [bacterium]